jgi:phosphopantothenoylcysteine decarboxylase/phosphopantothenate--cysteine ligase
MRIALGVCGGIAAYKAAELVRALQQDAYDVEVVMTAAAQQFVRPLTFAALTGHKVITGLWEGEPNVESAIEHIAVAQRIEALVVAPATADAVAKFAHGLADDFLSTLYLAAAVPVIVAPAMNVNMWEHPATKENLATLRARGVTIVEPGSGYLACGMEGSGRMAEPAEIASAVNRVLQQRHDMAGDTVLVTAGGTREAIDPVRYIGNRSSGKMGFALAKAASDRGARVYLVAGPTALATPRGCERIDVVTSEEMRHAVLERLPEATLVIKAAAVSDYRPRQRSTQKLKRSGPLTLELEPTEDILASVALRRNEGTVVIGFAAETEDGLAHARAKLERKGVDAIVLNDVSREDVGIDADRNAGVFVTRDGEQPLPESSKREMAENILDMALKLRAETLKQGRGVTASALR